MAGSILDAILQTKRKEVEELRRRPGLEELRSQAASAGRPRNFFAAMTKPPRRRMNLIAEVKRASPSAGVICRDFDPVAVAARYESAGADAISVLTDREHFQGDLAHLTAVRQAVSLPVLRKDFIIDPIQLYESRAAGADAVLLIAAALTPGALMDLVILSAELRMTAVVEVHDADELLRFRSLVGFPHRAYSLLGINNRDLATFRVDLNTTIRLAAMVDPSVPIISESGIASRADVERLRSAGVRGVLVGEMLMRSADVAAAVEELIGPARDGAAPAGQSGS